VSERPTATAAAEHSSSVVMERAPRISPEGGPAVVGSSQEAPEVYAEYWTCGAEGGGGGDGGADGGAVGAV
jgi:hypothetical protein